MFGKFNVEFGIPLEGYKWLTDISVHSCSSEYSGFPASNVLNPATTYWLSESGKITDQWMIFDFKKQVNITKLMIQVSRFECSVKDFRIESTDDDTNFDWVVVKECQARSGIDCIDEQNFEDFSVKARYLRLFYKNNWGPIGGNYILVTNVKFWGAELDF